jgi:outer membrane lipoprotein-sorting protein
MRRKSHIYLKKTLTSICFYLLSAAGFAQTAELVVNDYLKAIGGLEKWKSIETRMDEWLMIKPPVKNSKIFGIQNNDTSSVIINKYKRPDKTYIKFLKAVDSSSSIMCYNGEVLWTQSKNGKLNVQSKKDSEYFRQISMIGLIDVLLEKDTEIEYLGTEKLKDTMYHTLRIKRTGWFLSCKYYFDIHTGLPFCSVVIDSDTKRYTLFKNYREVNGVLFYHLEEVYDSDWNLESKTILKSIKINEPIADSEFGIPN